MLISSFWGNHNTDMTVSKLFCLSHISLLPFFPVFSPTHHLFAWVINKWIIQQANELWMTHYFKPHLKWIESLKGHMISIVVRASLVEIWLDARRAFVIHCPGNYQFQHSHIRSSYETLAAILYLLFYPHNSSPENWFTMLWWH